uniref:Uncharacterized protein n=1 Tax=Romanomermis culicivorax TaxID=13658 RepID=A0A915IS26_ROMCU
MRSKILKQQSTRRRKSIPFPAQLCKTSITAPESESESEANEPCVIEIEESRYQWNSGRRFLSCHEEKWWISTVVEVCSNQDNVKVKFMHPNGPSKAFQWLTKEDFCWIKLEDVTCKVNMPPVPESSRTFALDEETSDSIEQFQTERLYDYDSL